MTESQEKKIKEGLSEAYERSNAQRRKNLFEHERDQYLSDRKAQRRMKHSAPRNAASGDTIVDLMALETCARVGTEKKRPEYLASVYDALSEYADAYYTKLVGKTPEGFTPKEAEAYLIKPYETLKGLAESGKTSLAHTDGRSYDLSNLVNLWTKVKV